MRLVNWLIASIHGPPEPTREGLARRNDYVHRCARGTLPRDVPMSKAQVIARRAPAAAAKNDFHWNLVDGNINARYPGSAAEL